MNALTRKRAANVVYPRVWERMRAIREAEEQDLQCPFCGWIMTLETMKVYRGSECPSCEYRLIREFRAA